VLLGVDVVGLGQAVRAGRRGVLGGQDAADGANGAAVPGRLGYLTGGFTGFHYLGNFNRLHLACLVFGEEQVEASIGQAAGILDQWGYQNPLRVRHRLRGIFSQALLVNRSPLLEDLTSEAFAALAAHPANTGRYREMICALQRACASLGYCDPPVRTGRNNAPGIDGTSPQWAAWVERWHATSPLSPRVRATVRTIMAKAGRWLAAEHPSITEPGQWSRQTCAAWVAAVDRMAVGDYVQRHDHIQARAGQPILPRSKAHILGATRTFFRDLQELGMDRPPVRPGHHMNMGAGMRRVGLAGAASAELADGVVQLRPEDAMVEAMLRGWRAQQAARGLREDTAGYRERLVRRFQAFTNEFPWQWRPAHVDEWTLTLTAERHLAPSTIRGYQTDLRLFSEYLTDGRYGWAVACEEAFGTFPVPICHEWNTIAHLNDYEGSPEARPLSRRPAAAAAAVRFAADRASRWPLWERAPRRTAAQQRTPPTRAPAHLRAPLETRVRRRRAALAVDRVVKGPAHLRVVPRGETSDPANLETCVSCARHGDTHWRGAAWHDDPD